MPDLFEYTDYRAYLRDYFAERKRLDLKFSHRFVCQRLGLRSTNHALLIIQGKRNLTPALANKFSSVLKHTKRETQYFDAAVSFSQAKTHAEKDRHFATMMNMRRIMNIGKIEQWQYEYYAHWYNPVVLELASMPDYSGNVTDLATLLDPPITETQARKSVELLLKLGFLQEVNGRYVKRDQLLSTGPEAFSVSVINFHKRMSELANETFDRSKREERNMTSLTIETSPITYQKVIDEITEFRTRILALCATEPRPTRVYQFNFHLFPVSKSIIKEARL